MFYVLMEILEVSINPFWLSVLKVVGEEEIFVRRGFFLGGKSFSFPHDFKERSDLIPGFRLLLAIDYPLLMTREGRTASGGGWT